jgi:hypothetical protein
LTQENQT